MLWPPSPVVFRTVRWGHWHAVRGGAGPWRQHAVLPSGRTAFAERRIRPGSTLPPTDFHPHPATSPRSADVGSESRGCSEGFATCRPAICTHKGSRRLRHGTDMFEPLCRFLRFGCSSCEAEEFQSETVDRLDMA